MPLPDDQETAAADYNTTAAQPAPNLPVGQLTAAPEAPPSWQDVKSDPAFQAQPPEKQLIVQDRWATAARAYGKTLSDWAGTEKAFDEGVARQREIYSKAAGGITPDQARVGAAQALLDKAQEAGAQVPDVEAAKALLADHPDLSKAWEHRDIVNREGKMPWEPSVGENYFTSFGGRALARTSNLLNSAAEGVSRWVGAEDSAKFFKQQQDLVNEAYFKPQAGGAVHPIQDAMADATGTILATAPATLAAMAVPAAAVPAAVARLLPAAAAGTRWAAAAVHAGKFLVGSIPVATEFAASAYAEAYNAHLAENPEDEHGATQVANTAAAKTVAMLPAYALGGLGATAAEKAILPAIMKPIQRGISHFLFHSAANITASTVNHSIEESIKQGKPTFVPPTVEGAIQDVAFAVEPSLRAPHEQAIKNDMHAAAKDVVAGTNQQLLMFRQIVADPDAPAPMRELAQKNVDSIVSGANKFLTEIGEPPAPAEPKETLLETADRLKASGSVKTAEVIKEATATLPPTPDQRPRLQQIHDRLTELDAQFGGEGMVEVPERGELLAEQASLMAAQTPASAQEAPPAPVIEPKVTSEVKPDGTGAHQLDIPANATPEDIVTLKATVEKMDLPDEVRAAFDDTLAKAENKAAGVPEPKVAATGQEIYQPETPAEVAAVKAKIAAGNYVNTQEITVDGKTTIITRPQATIDKAVAEAQAKVKAAAAPAPKKPEGPTPGTYDSVKKHGLSKDEQLAIDAVAAGTKPIVMSSTSNFGKRAKKAGLTVIERILPDGTRERVAFKDPAAYEAFKAVDGLKGEEKWKAYGKAFGYTDAEVASFLERRKKIDAEKAAEEALPEVEVIPSEVAPSDQPILEALKAPSQGGPAAIPDYQRAVRYKGKKFYGTSHDKAMDELEKSYPNWRTEDRKNNKLERGYILPNGEFEANLLRVADFARKAEEAKAETTKVETVKDPEVVYHASKTATDKLSADPTAVFESDTTTKSPQLGVHLGTDRQTKGLAGTRTAFKLPEGKWLELPDLDNWTWQKVEAELEKRGLLTPADKKLYTGLKQAGGFRERALQAIIKDKGFVGVKYINKFEGDKTEPSYIVFDPASLKPATEKGLYEEGPVTDETKADLSQARGESIAKALGLEFAGVQKGATVGDKSLPGHLSFHVPFEGGKDNVTLNDGETVAVLKGKLEAAAERRRVAAEEVTAPAVETPAPAPEAPPVEAKAPEVTARPVEDIIAEGAASRPKGQEWNYGIMRTDTNVKNAELFLDRKEPRVDAAEKMKQEILENEDVPEPFKELLRASDFTTVEGVREYRKNLDDMLKRSVAEPVVKGELRKEIPAKPPVEEPLITETITSGGPVQERTGALPPVLEQKPLAPVVVGESKPLPEATAAAKAETAAEGKGSILAATAEGPQTPEQIITKVRETGVVPTLKEVQAMILGRAPTYADYQNKVAKDLWTKLKSEAAGQYPAETLPEGAKEIGTVEDKKGQTQETMGKHPVTGVHMPMVSEETGKDARGLPITKIRPKFTNNPEVTAAQIDTGQRVVIPEEMNRADINPAIEWAIDPVTGERYVIASTTPLGTFSEADTGDRSKRLEAEPTYSQAHRAKTAFDQAHQKVATEKLENLGESTAPLPVDEKLLAEDEARSKATKADEDFIEDSVRGEQNDGVERESSPVETQAAADELERLGMDPSTLATEDTAETGRDYTAVRRTALQEEIYQAELRRAARTPEQVKADEARTNRIERDFLEEQAKQHGMEEEFIPFSSNTELQEYVDTVSKKYHVEIEDKQTSPGGWFLPDGKFLKMPPGINYMHLGQQLGEHWPIINEYLTMHNPKLLAEIKNALKNNMQYNGQPEIQALTDVLAKKGFTRVANDGNASYIDGAASKAHRDLALEYAISKGQRLVHEQPKGRNKELYSPKSDQARTAKEAVDAKALTNVNFSHLAEMGMLAPPKTGSRWKYTLSPEALDNFLKFSKNTKLRSEGAEAVQVVLDQFSNAIKSGHIELELINMPNANFAGDRTSLGNGRSKIRLNVSADHEGGISTTIIHELAHHVTSEKLTEGYKANPVELKAIDNLHKLLDYTASKEFESQFGHAPSEKELASFQLVQGKRGKEKQTRNYYGFSNVREFVAEVFSNPRFQRILSAIDGHPEFAAPKGKIRTLLDNIHEVLRNLFTGSEVRSGSALSQALNEALGLANMPIRPEALTEFGPADAAAPATLSPNKSAAGAPTDGKIVDWLKKTSQRLFTAEGNLPKDVFNLWTDRQGKVNEQTREIKYATRDLYNAIQDHFKIAGPRRLVSGLADVPKNFVEKMNAALGGKIPFSDLPPEIAAPLEVMRAHIDRLSQQLIDRGLVTGDLELKVAKDLGSYMARSFKLFDDPKWAEKIPQEVRNKARAWILSELKSKNPNATSDDANRHMEAMLQDWKDQGDTRGSGGRLGSQDFSLFIKRKNLPVEILDLLGEHRDPVINYARSVTRMATLLGNNEFLRGVLKAGKDKFLYENGKEPAGFTSQIATEKNKTLGPLAGLRTSPEVAQAFKEFEKVSNIDNPLFRHYMKLTAAAKGAKTVGSLLTQVRNAEQFWFFGMNGHYNMKPLKEALLSTAADTGIGEKSIDSAKWREFYQKMLRLQVVDQSARANELRDTLNEAILEDAGTSDFTTTGKRSIKNLTKATFGVATRAYQISDDVGKVVGFMNETARQKAQHPEWTEDQAERAAAQRIKLTYPTYSMVPEAIKLFRRQPVLGPFMTFSYEVFRTSYHNLKLTQEAVANAAAAKDPAVKKAYQKEAAQRMAGQMLVLGGASTALSAISRSLVGMSAQQEDDARKFLPPWDADSTLMFTGNDKDGPSYLNLSYQNPYSYITDPVMSAVRSAHDEKGLVDKMVGSIGGFLTSLGAPFVNTSILSGNLIELYANKDEHGREIYNTAADSDTKMRQILGHLYEALEPGTLTRLRKRIIPAAKGETRMNQQLSLGRELTSEFTGFKQQQLNYRQQLGFKGRDFVRNIAEADSIFRATALREGSVSDEEVQDAYAESEGARFRMWKELYSMNQASIRQGLTQAEVSKLLKANGVPSKTLAAIRQGRYRPLKPTDFVKQTLRDRGRKLPELVSPHADDPLSE